MLTNPVNASPLPPSPQTAVPNGATAAAAASQTPLYYLGFTALLLLLFVVFSRLAETIAVLIGANLRISMTLLLVSTAVAVVQRDAIRRLRGGAGFYLILLTGWFFLCVPTSVHKGGSVRHLTSYWITSVLAAFCVLVYPNTTASLRRILYAITAGVLLVGFARSESSVFTLGALGNPNLYSQHLLYGVPFLFLPLARNGVASFKGIIAAACISLLVVKVLYTGSRASLIAVAILGFVFFLSLPVMQKLIAVACVIPLAAAALLTMPEQAWQRYSTLFSQDETIAHTEEEISAIESANARKRHLEQSIDLTIRNPILGVGPGMFAVASADYSKELGERAYWKETHNSFTQISSESGLTGLLLYLAMLFSAVLTLWKGIRLTRRAPRGSELESAGQIAVMLLFSMLAMIITGAFSSSAYLHYFPLLCAFATVTARIIDDNRAPAGQRPPVLAARSPQPGMRLRPAAAQRSLPNFGLPAAPYRRQN